jgi:hypothetical protein
MDLIDTRALTPSITKNDFSIFGLAQYDIDMAEKDE